MKMEKIKGKITSFCQKVGKKNMIIAACFVAVALALVIGVSLYGGEEAGYDYSQGVGMQPDSNNTQNGSNNDQNQQNAADTYFSTVQVNRQRTRDEALEVLQSVVDNEQSTATAKEEALAEINKLAKVMEAEANIETLIVAKGFTECVAVVSDEGANVVVKSEGLQAAQIAQINEIVYEQTGILPVNIKIIQR